MGAKPIPRSGETKNAAGSYSLQFPWVRQHSQRDVRVVAVEKLLICGMKNVNNLALRIVHINGKLVDGTV